MSKQLISKSLNILFFVAILGVAGPAAAEPVFGRYTGVLKHENLGRDQLAKLDFVFARKGANELDLKAVLTLHMGDFASAEYVSFHYDKVRYNLVTGSLVFHTADQALSIFVKRFAGGKLEGEVVSIWGGRVGTLVLSQQEGDVLPSQPLIEPIWGEYQGKCGIDRAKIHLYTYRNTEGTGHMAQPFFAYTIKASLPIGCRDGNCVNFRFVNGSYNFFEKKNQLTLEGTRITLRCTVGGDDLECGVPDDPFPGFYDMRSCKFKRISKETSGPRQFTPVAHEGVLQAPFTAEPEPNLPKAALSLLQSGEYKGYVFHEFRNQYQSASLNISVFRGDPEEGTRIAAHGKVFFGDHESVEKIPYAFDEVAYPPPTVFPQSLVLSRSGQNSDAVVQITEVNKGVIKGFWYSNIFGRVGPFELHKEGLPTLPENAKVMLPLSGFYRSTKTTAPSLSPDSQWLLRLVVTSGNTPAGETENPFFPNTIRGSMYLWPITPSLPITNGSYDFYTGRFGISKNQDNGSVHGWIGTQISRDELSLHHVLLPPLTPVPRFVPEVFKLEKEFP